LVHAQTLQIAQLPQPASVHAVCPYASEFAVKTGVFEAVLLLVGEVTQQMNAMSQKACLLE
jgi:hypothetical protein